MVVQRRLGTVERRLRAWAYVEQKSARKGTEATVSFSGTGAILSGLS